MPEFRRRHSYGRGGKIVFLCTVLITGCARGENGGVPLTTDAMRGPALGAASRTEASAGRKISRNVVGNCDVIYSFGSSPDGADPVAGLTGAGKTLYGTTSGGGANNLGTVFSSTTSGSEHVLYDFKGRPDGSSPLAGLTNLKGTFYGTTSGGGSYGGGGTVFAITKAGKEHVVYSFTGGTDGSQPNAGLIDVDGTLYGTTIGGGVDGTGTVFSITTSGTENVLHSFADSPDGAAPRAGLVYSDGAFYGTTSNGGTAGHGTVFKVTPGGTETVLYSFAGEPDGAQPLGGLIVYKKALYGTTFVGGANNDGTVFKIALSGSGGTETVLHSFGTGDAGLPEAGLINLKGTFYGTGTDNLNPEGTGGVFSITPAGAEQELCSFPGADLDAVPQAPVTYFKGALYGTTSGGGSAEQGTVFTFPI